MSPDSLVSICTYMVQPAWLLLIFAPQWKLSARLISAFIIPLLLAVLYLYLVAVYLGRTEGGLGSLEEVRLAFESPHILLAGWIHYLAFDLFIGSWEVREAQRLKISHLWVIPCLLLTFLLGPVGLLMFLTLRAVMKGRVLVDEDGATFSAS